MFLISRTGVQTGAKQGAGDTYGEAKNRKSGKQNFLASGDVFMRQSDVFV
jgi:hypothetical protein